MQRVAIAHHNKRLALAALLIIGFLTFALTRPGIAPAGGPPLVVNSTANISDSVCDATNCTLREAIDDVNAGLGDVITFDPGAFPPGAPGVIDIEGGDGVLPPITADLTIDATGSGVTIDGDSQDNNIAVAPGLAVTGTHEGFSFVLLGGGGFTIRDIGGRGINVVGQDFALDTLTIDSVTITDTLDHAIYVTGVKYASNVSLTNSMIRAGNTGFGVVMGGPNIPSVNFAVTGNDIDASLTDMAAGGAVLLNMQDALVPGSVADIAIDNNTRLTSRGASGVRLAHCVSGPPCVLDNVQINASISGNGEVSAEGDTIQVRFAGNPAAPGSVNSSISLAIEDNTAISAGSDVIDVESRLCCGSNNNQAFSINGNGPLLVLPGGSDAIDFDATACCAPGSGVTFDLRDNAAITADEGNAVQLLLPCCGDNNVNVESNGTISSANDNGILILACVDDETDPRAAEAACLQVSSTLLNITDNTLSNSPEDGIHICCGEFQRGGERSAISNNTVTGNQRDGIEIDTSHGIVVGPGNVVTGNGTSGDGDNNGIEIGYAVSLLVFDRYDVQVPANANTVTQNQTFANEGLGVDLVGFADAGDPNDPSILDLEYAIVGCNVFGAAPIDSNGCLAAPVLSGVSGDAAQGQACDSCLIEVFLANGEPPDQPPPPPFIPPESGLAGGVVPPQHGEGAVYLASGEANGAGNFSIELPCGLGASELTVTATDEDGNTSEFAQNFTFGGTSDVCTPTATPDLPPPPTSTPTMPFTPVPSQTQAATQTPTRTPTPTATPTSDAGVCGDVDGNGSVNSIDAAIVLQYSAGLLQTIVQPHGADTNGDGDINSIDAALILQNTAGLLPTLTC